MEEENKEEQRIHRVKKQKKNRYIREKYRQYVIVSLLIVLSFLVILKVKYVAEKVKLVDEGLNYLSDARWIEAEKSLQQTKHYSWFSYKEELTNESLEKLEWITTYHPLLGSLHEAMQQSIEALDLESFEATAKEYKESGINDLPESQKQYLLEQHPVHVSLNEGWRKFLALMEETLSYPLEHEEYDWAKEKIFDVPESYFKDDKNKSILSLFEKCDTSLYEAHQDISDIASFEQLLTTINDIYATNQKCGYDTSWLTQKLQANIYESLLTKSQEEVSSFTNYIKTYRGLAQHEYKDEKIEEIVNSFMDQKDQEMKKLLYNKQYEEILKLYNDMAYFKNYKEEIKKAEAMQKYDEPERLLKKPIENYDFIKAGNYAFNADKYIFGILRNGQKLELHTLSGSLESYEEQTYSYGLSAADIRATNIEEVQIADKLILFTLTGTQGTKQAKVVALNEGKFELIFEIEGESVSATPDLTHIHVNKPTGEEVVAEYTYLYDGTTYVKQELEVINVALTEPNLLAYAGKMVRFICYVPEDSSFPQAIPEENTGEDSWGGLTAAYHIEDNTYFLNQMAYIYWEDGSYINKGIYTVMGKVVGTTYHYDEETGLQVEKPKIKILEMKAN